MNITEEERSVMRLLRREIVQFRSDTTAITDSLNSTVQDLESQSENLLNETKKKLKELNDEYQQISKQYAELEYKLEETRRKLFAKEDSLPVLENRYDIFDSSLNSLHRYLESLNDRMSYVLTPEEQSSIQRQISKCCGKISNIQRQLSDTKCEISETKQMLQRLEGEIYTLNEQKDETYQLKDLLYRKCCFYEEKAHRQEELFLHLQGESESYANILRQTALNTSNRVETEISGLDGCIACIDQYITSI